MQTHGFLLLNHHRDLLQDVFYGGNTSWNGLHYKKSEIVIPPPHVHLWLWYLLFTHNHNVLNKFTNNLMRTQSMIRTTHSNTTVLQICWLCDILGVIFQFQSSNKSRYRPHISHTHKGLSPFPAAAVAASPSIYSFNARSIYDPCRRNKPSP